MRKLAVVTLIFLQFFLFTSCNKQSSNKPICVDIVKNIKDNKLEICFTIDNKTGKNIYFSPISFPFSVTKEYRGEINDAMIEFYHSAPEYDENSNNVSADFMAIPKKDVKKTGKCGDEYWGPFFENLSFHDTVIKKLLKFQTSSFRHYYTRDTLQFSSYRPEFGLSN